MTDPRAIPAVTPGPRIADVRLDSGGGNNPLKVTGQALADDSDDPDNDMMDMMVVPDLSANAPRMAPSRTPAAAQDQSPAAWRQASDICFAEDYWRSEQTEAATALAADNGSAMDSLAAFVGLGVVLGSYWGAPVKNDEERRKRERFESA